MTLDGMEKAISSVYYVGKGGKIDKHRYKTHITHIGSGFDFLGWNFRKIGDLIKRAKD